MPIAGHRSSGMRCRWLVPLLGLSLVSSSAPTGTSHHGRSDPGNANPLDEMDEIEDSAACMTCMLQVDLHREGFEMLEKNATDPAEAVGPGPLPPAQALESLLYQLWLPILVGLVLFFYQDPPNAGGSQIAAVNGLRFVAAVGIFAEHATLLPGTLVGVFLTLSGCLLSLSRVKALTGPEGISSDGDFLVFSPSKAVRFIVVRAARIYPLYFAVMSLKEVWKGELPEHIGLWSLLLQPFQLIFGCIKTFANMVAEDPREIFLLRGIPGTVNTYWFMHAVIFLYALYPFLEYCLLRPATSVTRLLVVAGCCMLTKLLIVLWATMVLSNDGFEVGDYWYRHDLGFFWAGKVPWYSFAPFRIPDFAMGMLVPHIATYAKPNDVLVQVSDVLLLLYFALAVLPSSRLACLWIDMHLHCPLITFAVWGLCFGPRPSMLGRLLGLDCLVTFGTMSYGIYAFQEPLMTMMGVYYPNNSSAGPVASCRMTNTCFVWFQYTTLPDIVNLFLAFSALVLLTISGFHLVEEPARKALQAALSK